MQKIVPVIILTLLLFLQSCSDSSKNQQFLIGVSQCSDDAWRRSMNEEMQREASFNNGIELKIKTAYDSNQKQIRDIESFIADRVDLLIVSPNEAVPLTPVIEKAMKAGIPVVLVDRKTKSQQYTAYIGADNYQIGKEVGIYAANLLNGKGNVVEIRGLAGSTPDFERHAGFMSVIQNYPEINIIYSNDGGWLRSQAKEKMAEALKLQKQVDLVFAHNDEMGTGAREAVLVNNKIKKPVIIGIDALPGTDGGIQKVINGTLDATFIYPTGGEKAIQTAVRILHHEPFDRENSLYTAVVDKTNARVLKLQTDQIIEHQNRIGLLNQILNDRLSQYKTQQTFLTFSLLVIIIILVLLGLLFRSNRHKNKINKELELNNIAINKQKEELAEQRDQLIALSKSLEDATQAKLIFFTNISHEFRTPLTLLHGPLIKLAQTENLSREGKMLITLMSRNVQILMKLIDQIIEFRKYENGKMKMFYTLGDLKIFLTEITNSFAEMYQKKHIHFNFQTDNSDYTVWFDSDKIEQICYNLISNAIKFTPENGKIQVSLSKISSVTGNFAKISVTDTGCGISEDDLQHIFDRFYRVNENISGSGIGLALTKILVEQHNGTIDVESRSGKGSCFAVTIPFKQKNIAVQEQFPVLDSKHFEPVELVTSDEYNEQPETAGKNDNPVLLIVEDNADMRSYLKLLLHDDYTVYEAENGQNGLLKAKKLLPDLIISDVKMEVMDGFSFCKNIKENLATSHIPFILLTAFALDEQKVVGFESGADAYIPKPFNEELLKIRIRKLIESREKIKISFQENLTFGERKDSVTKIDKAFITKFREIVEENLIESNLNVDEIGKSLGLSRVQLYRKIKSLTNYAPNELVRNIRLKAAEKMLINSEKTVSEIAYDTGFTSPSYFTKCFKEYFNESPTDYLKRIKN
ncbi:MAG: substrate-binding domain-containing protein [Paludibacter sp.]|nr:substrate-binding domain-containing protein [Paludibacter sp.]